MPLAFIALISRLFPLQSLLICFFLQPISSDNRVVSARGSNLDFHSDSQIVTGYTAKFKDKTPITPSKVRNSTASPIILLN